MTAESPTRHHTHRLPVVGLGASAGGIKALKEFFSAVPADSGVAYVAILHLSPDYESRLAEVLQTSAAIPVTQVTGTMQLEPDHVYVIAPKQTLEMSDDMLLLSEATRPEQRRAPVDVFFRTLADARGVGAVCVVLSGTGPNGSAGLKRVKEYGGLVLVQDPAEADYPDMPRNSIATGLTDYVLPARQMPERIRSYFDRLKQDDETTRQLPEDPDAMRDVLAVLRVRTGQDFANYKTATLQRRIERRMNLRGIDGLTNYARFIRQEPNEAVALMRDLLISVTNFFRDPQMWQILADQIVPRLFANKTSQDQLRVWIPGCATGEEAYTLAILLAERAADQPDAPAIQVFATDLDERAIAIARESVFTDADVADVSEQHLARFFYKEVGGYRIKREIREMVLFAHHNVIKDPPFSHLDLISCRNLLIYLNRTIQERVIETFHYALRPGGYLFLGTAESPDGTNDLFVRVDGAAHIYESRTVTSRVARPLMDAPAPRALTRHPEPRSSERISPADLHLRLLEHLAPPSIVVTHDHHLVHVSEKGGRFLAIPGGEPSRELMRLILPELKPDLRTALHRAHKERISVEVRGITVHFDDADRRVDLFVHPILREDNPASGYFLILFEEGAAVEAPRPRTLVSPSEPRSPQLEDELTRVKAQLRSTVGQYETRVEEATASNEELQGMNEELRSAAEELETSKEELQSVNEELTTVNQELKIKIDELRLTNNDFQNLINATDIGTIFLDRALRVKFSTPRAQDVFNLIESDIGRPLSDITTRLKYHRIHDDVQGVLDRLRSVEREVETQDGRWHLMRLLPYRTADDRIDGVVLTFQDVTDRHEAQRQMRVNEERFRLLIDNAIDYAIFFMTDAGTIDTWNSAAERMFGFRADEVVGKNVDMLFTPEDRAAGVPQKELSIALQTGRAIDERYHVRKNGSRFYCSGVTQRTGKGTGLAKIARDLSEQRRGADALQRAREGAEHMVEQRTRELAAEVQQHAQAKAHVTELLHQLVRIQERERLRMAVDLHDHVGQQLTALQLTLERAQGSAEHPRHGEIEEAITLTQKLSRDIDFLAWELRPASLDQLGLRAALPTFLREWSRHAGIEGEFRLLNYEAGHLGSAAELAFYRIAQEALNNVAKHARATRADVVLATRDGHVVMVIEDNGVGFNLSGQEASQGFGLGGMRERANLVGATLEIESSPGRGTSLFVRTPVAGRAD